MKSGFPAVACPEIRGGGASGVSRYLYGASLAEAGRQEGGCWKWTAPALEEGSRRLGVELHRLHPRRARRRTPLPTPPAALPPGHAGDREERRTSGQGLPRRAFGRDQDHRPSETQLAKRR